MSASMTWVGVRPADTVVGVENATAPPMAAIWFLKIATLLSWLLATTMSSLPSLLTSPTATEMGLRLLFVVPSDTAGAYPPPLRPRNTLTALFLLSVTIRSRRPSRLRSAAIGSRGLAFAVARARLVGTRNEPSPVVPEPDPV